MKYTTEAALNIYTKMVIVMRVDEIYETKQEELSRFNIYGVIATDRPIIKNIEIDGEGGLHIEIIQAKHKYKFCYNMEEFTDDFKDKTRYSFNENTLKIKYTDSDIKHAKLNNFLNHNIYLNAFTVKKTKLEPEGEEKSVVYNSVDHLLFNYAKQKKVKLDFELLYIGQSSRIDQRLKGHETIQKIQADYMRNHPDKVLYIILFEIEPQIFMGMDGTVKNISVSETDDVNHLLNIVDDISSPAPMKQIINICEAALIYHMKPVYNDLLKTNFPNVKGKSYQHYFNLDYCEFIFEFKNGLPHHCDFPIINLRTEKNVLSNTFSLGDIVYSLHKDKNRKKSIFEIFK